MQILHHRPAAMQPQTACALGKGLDIGCGSREERKPGCFGMDLNPKYSPDLLADCDQGLPFADDSLDLINADNSLEHFRHPFLVLQECYRCLRPGGRLRVAVPNLQFLPTMLLALVFDVDRYFFWYMRLPHKIERTVHHTLFTPFLLRRMVGDAGFRVLRHSGWLYSKEAALEAEKPVRGGQ